MGRPKLPEEERKRRQKKRAEYYRATHKEHTSTYNKIYYRKKKLKEAVKKAEMEFWDAPIVFKIENEKWRYRNG
jgi:hypothetical protein